MYQVLYRKWRPQMFSDVYGQPQVTVTLCNELKSGRIAHAYLFTGSRGTGKTTCAKILAKAVNCLNPHEGNPCNECENCVGIDNESILDVVEMDAASNNGVEDVRSLREEVRYTPAAAKYRVLIIDEVHMLSNQAFNALLKTLEEPPEHVVFILATTEVHKLPATILSRCQRFDFRRIPSEDISQRLHYVAQREGCTLTDDAAMLIARLSDGGMRDALSLLDQCIGQSKDVDESVVYLTAGITGRGHLIEITDAISQNNTAQILDVINNLHSSSKDMMRLTQELTEHFRNLMILKCVQNPKDLIAVSAQELQELEECAKKIKIETILHAIDALVLALEKMGAGANRRVELEMALIKIANPHLDTEPSALLRRIEKLEASIKKGLIMPQMSQSKQTPQMTVEQSVPSASSDKIIQMSKGAQPIEQWQDILYEVRDASMALYGALKDSSGYINGVFVLVDTTATGMALLRDSSLKEYLRRAVAKILHLDCKLGPYKTENNEKKEDDPFAAIEKMASEAGIPIE